MTGTTTIPERAGREGDQPLPTPGAEDVLDSLERRIPELEAAGDVPPGTAAFVLPLLRARVAIGVKRYGRRLETFNTRDACADKLSEDLDGIMYGEQVRLQYVALERRLADALEQLRSVDALRLAAEGRADRAEAAAEEARQGWGAESMLASDALARANLAEARADKAEADLANHVEALDRRVDDLKAQLAAARANWEAERAALEAETAARIQVEQQLRRTQG